MSELIPLILSSNYNKFEVSFWYSFEVFKHLDVMMSNLHVWPIKNYHPATPSGRVIHKTEFIRIKSESIRINYDFFTDFKGLLTDFSG